jgi:hypothetical protein
MAILEFRAYSLHPGTRVEYHHLFVEETAPLLAQHNIKVVGYGPSRHGEDSYYLIRAFENLADRDQREDAFYSSAEWRRGPREAVLALIDTMTTVVIALDDVMVEALRRDLSGGGTERVAMCTFELLSISLKPRRRSDFQRLYGEQALPLLRRWGMDVVAHGPSLHDEDTYYVIRAFASLADRQRREDDYYASTDWRQGPREAILALFESTTTVVVELGEATVEGLRRS